MALSGEVIPILCPEVDALYLFVCLYVCFVEKSSE